MNVSYCFFNELWRRRGELREAHSFKSLKTDTSE